MRRYPHYITRAAAGRWSDLVICVDAKSTYHDVDAKRTMQVEILVSWHTSILLKQGDTYVDGSICCGESIKGFWDYIKCWAVNHYNIWIVSYQCTRMWSLLGFWDQLESGNVSISRGQSERAKSHAICVRKMRQVSTDPLGPMSSGAMSRMSARDTGVLVAEDVPSIACITLPDRGAKITWVDTRNYGGETVGAEQPGAGRAASIARWWVDYSSLLRRCKLGSPRTTAGSQAFNGWRYGHYDGGVYCHVNARAAEIESASYHGGRCECFRVGHTRGATYLVDVRSMYPAICSRTHVPIRLLHCVRGDSPLERPVVRPDQGVIADVLINTCSPDYPKSHGGITVWPTGSIRCVLAGPELTDAIDRGRVRAWYGWCIYEMGSVLKEYADAIYQAREQAEAAGCQAMADTIKKLLVSLPGKFAQRSRQWIDAPHISPAVQWGVWYGSDDMGQPCRYRSLGGIVQRDTDMGLGGEAVPAIAAWITSAGRMILLDAIRICGWDEVYYCDTDSLILTETGYRRLVDAGKVRVRELGAWQLREVITSGEIIGIKHYVHNGKRVCAGLPYSRGEPDLGGNGYWLSDTPTWQIQGGCKPNATRRLVPYSRSSYYQHGTIGPDGRVTPIHLQDSI